MMRGCSELAGLVSAMACFASKAPAVGRRETGTTALAGIEHARGRVLFIKRLIRALKSLHRALIEP